MAYKFFKAVMFIVLVIVPIGWPLLAYMVLEAGLDDSATVVDANNEEEV